MADIKKRLPCNVPGDFFVDASCIDCDICTEIAPAIFGKGKDSACVIKQPKAKEEEEKALMALLSCPVGAIGTKSKEGVREVIKKFPAEIEDGVYRCGLSSKKSYGAMSYFILHPDGNWMIDSPRENAHLLKNIASLGGLKYIFLTHEDDVADAEFYAKAFNAQVVIHERDAHAYPKADIKVSGDDPTNMGDFTIIPTPGHTAGHMALLYKNFLFTGDHLWYSPERKRLWASEEYCWYSWSHQLKSIKRLLDFRFEWVLPGHGRSIKMSHKEIKRQIKELLLMYNF
ncbi:MAG: MBL fold metallo-hydrolase [Hydrogenobacter thermophilus]|uniref:MBL fold metallo-hydrolase n=1 Tax=Hydrogenobacter thermophilus TaxID=940 RepID=UPI001C76C011|nr:MBL fold metallo-hydrolase [Hydrogenobacter thermophilus]QWK19446.1 MAG: MBL fold metallo-hydrolase [Hydrogenobacter thermophilus]